MVWDMGIASWISSSVPLLCLYGCSPVTGRMSLAKVLEMAGSGGICAVQGGPWIDPVIRLG